MKVREALELFRQAIASYCSGYDVIISRQSRVVKPSLPLISLTPGNVRRPQAPNFDYYADGFPSYYESKLPITIDLFSHGDPVSDERGNTVAFENTAMDEMLRITNYLNSPPFVEWCFTNNISVLIDKEAQDVTGLVNDSNYEFRSRQEVTVSFTQEVSGVDIGAIEQVEVIDGNSNTIILAP